MRKFLAVLIMSSITAFAAPAKHTAAAQPPVWTISWAASPSHTPKTLAKEAGAANSVPDETGPGKTFRNVVHLSLGGKAIRLELSNELGNAPLEIDRVRVALSAGKDATKPGTDTPVTFGGGASITIPAGAMVVSDIVPLPVDNFADLAVSLYVPDQSNKAMTIHELGLSSNYIANGNVVSAATLEGAKRVTSWYVLKGVEVNAGPHAAAVVALGDSITDGARSTPDTNQRWPNLLAKRLYANAATANLAVVDEGISGNRLLHDGTGPSALARLDRDVLAQPGVKYLIVLLGINDIGHTAKPRAGVLGEGIDADQLKWALTQIAMRAHAHGIKVYPATLTPFKGAGYQDDNGLKLVEAENEFIRTSPLFDGHIDFNKAVSDPQNPGAFAPQYDGNDHLHPSDAGHKAMADSIDLSLFTK